MKGKCNVKTRVAPVVQVSSSNKMAFFRSLCALFPLGTPGKCELALSVTIPFASPLEKVELNPELFTSSRGAKIWQEITKIAGVKVLRAWTA